MPTVELINAFVWSCRCGHDSFVRGLPVDPAEIPGDDDSGDLEDEWLEPPVSVTCSHCGAEFATGMAE